MYKKQRCRGNKVRGIGGSFKLLYSGEDERGLSGFGIILNGDIKNLMSGEEERTDDTHEGEHRGNIRVRKE